MKHHTLAPGYSLHPDGYVLVPLRGKHGAGKFAKVDLADYDKVASWRWYVNHHGYAYGQQQTPERVRLQMFLHHLVMPTPEGQVCDHINGDRLDARSANLRASCYTTNNRNRIPRGRQSKFKGLTLDKRSGRWQVRIWWQGRHWNFGSYENEADAARIYDSAALFIDPDMGDHALNFPGESVPVSPFDLRRRAFENGNIRRKTSQFRGVVWKAKNNAFQAFYARGETVYLGLFTSEEDAARAHDSYALTVSADATVNFADSAPRSRDEILDGSIRWQRPPKRRIGTNSRHGYAGVVLHSRASKKKWQARIHLEGKKRSLGYFETLEEAARAYDAALVKAGFSPVNFG